MTVREKLKVLCLDGGGTKGILEAIFLNELEKKSGKKIIDMFDFFSGVSTGGIMALLLNSGYSTKDIIDFYTGSDDKIIFKPKFIRLPWGAVKYPSNQIESVLQSKFKDDLFGNTTKPVMVVSCATYPEKKPIFFVSTEDTYRNCKKWELARATSAAPTFFAPFKLDNLTLVDGGLACNNPTLYTVVEIQKQHPEKELLVVSLGTGSPNKPISYDTLIGWNIINWANQLFGLVSDYQSDTTDYALSKLNCCESYYRFQPVIPENMDNLDDTRDAFLDNLKNIALTNIRGAWSEQLDQLMIDLQT